MSVTTLSRYSQPHTLVANCLYLAFTPATAILHIFRGPTVPVGQSRATLYCAYPGVQPAMVRWGYGHNAVGLLVLGVAHREYRVLLEIRLHVRWQPALQIRRGEALHERRAGTSVVARLEQTP